LGGMEKQDIFIGLRYNKNMTFRAYACLFIIGLLSFQPRNS